MPLGAVSALGFERAQCHRFPPFAQLPLSARSCRSAGPISSTFRLAKAFKDHRKGLPVSDTELRVRDTDLRVLALRLAVECEGPKALTDENGADAGRRPN
jgi:hypothetical protein